MIKNELYTYKATVTRVIDADTIEMSLDLGFSTEIKKERFRLAGIDAFETRMTKGVTEEQKALGLEAKAKLKEMIEGKEIIIKTIKNTKGKFGRYLGFIYFGDVCINDWVIKNGYGKYKTY